MYIYKIIMINKKILFCIRKFFKSGTLIEK